MGIFGNEGENGIWGQAGQGLVGPVGTQCGYFLSGGGKIELPCKLTRIRGTLFAWDFFRALQLKQITVASCSNMVYVVYKIQRYSYYSLGRTRQQLGCRSVLSDFFSLGIDTYP